MDMRYRERSSSLTSEANPGAESVRMTVGGPSSRLIPSQSVINVSRGVSRRTFSIMHVTVYDVTYSRFIWQVPLLLVPYVFLVGQLLLGRGES